MPDLTLNFSFYGNGNAFRKKKKKKIEIFRVCYQSTAFFFFLPGHFATE